MEAAATHLLRPAARRCVTSTRTALKQQLRHKATAARTKRALNIPPHPSFLTPDAPHEQDTIIFNPPSAAPSVYHTPFKFLPKTDPRRRANLASLFERHFGSGPNAKPDNLPVVAWTKEKKATTVSDRGPITREEVEEMRRLRAEDPHKWTVRALSIKFDMPMGFIMACCQAPRSKIEFERRKVELMRQRWGPAKAKAVEDRERRREMLYRGDI